MSLARCKSMWQWVRARPRLLAVLILGKAAMKLTVFWWVWSSVQR